MIRRLSGMAFRFAAKTVFCVIVAPILYIAEPFYPIRLGIIRQRIGQLALNTDAFFRRQQLSGKPETKLHIFAAYEPANHQLLQMYKRHLHIWESKWFARVMYAWRPLISRTRFWHPMEWNPPRGQSNGIYNLMNNSKTPLFFTPEEEARGKAGLAEMGIGENDWFVCIHARDAAYFKKWRPESIQHWDARDFKNCDIKNYMKAAEYIAERGGYAIRMGAFTDEPIPDTGNPRIIDYAMKHRTDFMDIYLSAKCRFFLASSSGLNAVAAIFDVPVAVANFFAPTGGLYHDYDLMTIRRIKRTALGKVVPWPEAIGEGFFARNFGMPVSDKMDVFEFEENTPEDILDLCKDMIDKLDGKAPPQGAPELQERFVKEYLNHHPDGHYISKLGPTFAIKNRDHLFPELVS